MLSKRVKSFKPHILPATLKWKRRWSRRKRNIFLFGSCVLLFFVCYTFGRWLSFTVRESTKALDWEISGNLTSFDSSKSVDFVSSEPHSSSLLYLILSGQKTVESRGPAVWNTWASVLLPEDVLFFTERVDGLSDKVDIPLQGLLVAYQRLPGAPIVVVRPADSSQEKNIAFFNAWSHLVRLRVAYDRILRNETKDKEHEWIVLVDDDTFLFHDRLKEYLKNFDGYREMIYMGFAEYVRIDNGDSGPLSELLRDVHVKGGNQWCTLRGESGHGNGTFEMCKDVFCKNCPWIPQGGFIVLSRRLVEHLRPHLEACEVATKDVCTSCGSQRLYFCIQRFASESNFYPLSDIQRFPWWRSRRSDYGRPISFHGFDQQIAGNFTIVPFIFERLWNLVQRANSLHKMVTYEDVANDLGCNGEGFWSLSGNEDNVGICKLPDNSIQLAPTSTELLMSYLNYATPLQQQHENIQVSPLWTIAEPSSQMNNHIQSGTIPFSRIYVLNRNICLERWQLIQEKATAFHIPLTRFPATDFSEFTLDDPPISISHAKVAGFSSSVTTGQVACTYSHMRIWKDVLEHQYPVVLILEDDVFFTKEAIERLPSIMKAVEMGSKVHQKPWHWIFFRRHALGNIQLEKVWYLEDNSTDSNAITIACSSWGTSAYALSLQGAQFLTEHIEEYVMPLDVQIAQLQEDFGEEFVTLSACKNGPYYTAPCPETIEEFTDEEKGSCSYSASQMGDSKKIAE
ncbi:hypothetical protein GpartN1_g4833.t1 [Galdieria partita]|uniref:Glycosyl transferase family 25 domain-containing protein n=1 Tax=Galdieria partita TaxID=83374 RepID=A0A9C7US15_9RHOD|nr:hypothetical protein GpartN1_g4833.t1 [Galdieria partita]